MPVVKVRERYQLTIPEEIRERLGLEVGDYVELSLKGEVALITPKKLVDKRDLWFWSKGWQKKERSADGDLAANRTKEFKNVDDLIDDLNA